MSVKIDTGILSFRSAIPIEDSLVFDAVYEESLQFELDEKRSLIQGSAGNVVYLFIDGQLAGETYGLSPANLKIELDEDIEDCDPSDESSIYCYSTTILPAFQGRGRGKLLKAYWLGLVKGHGVDRVIGHATSPAMVEINRLFGATFGPIHERWYDTDRTAHFYTIDL